MYCGAYIISVLSFSFVGFVDKNYSFAPPVGFNLTFTCPAGQVFESDWLAVPFVMMTCQVKTVKSSIYVFCSSESSYNVIRETGRNSLSAYQ